MPAPTGLEDVRRVHRPADRAKGERGDAGHPDALDAFLGRLDEGLAGVAATVPDTHGSFPETAIERLRAAGALSATVPLEHGGLGLCDPARGEALKRVLAGIGRCDQVLGRLYEGHANAHVLVFRYGDAEARERVAADARAGRLSGVWNTEPPEGGLALDAAAGMLRGRKSYASGAGSVTRPLVTARLEDGRSQMLIAPLEAGERADLNAWRARGMRASATGTVDFEGYPIARAILVGEPDRYHEEPVFSGGAWRFLAVHLGGIEAVHLGHKAHLLRLRRQEDPHQLSRLGQSAVAVETARAFVDRACALANGQGDARSAVAYVNLARAAVERAGLDVIELAERSVGLSSMLEDHPLERITRDLAVYLRQPGPDHALTNAARRLFEIDGCDLSGDGRA